MNGKIFSNDNLSTLFGSTFEIIFACLRNNKINETMKLSKATSNGEIAMKVLVLMLVVWFFFGAYRRRNVSTNAPERLSAAEKSTMGKTVRFVGESVPAKCKIQHVGFAVDKTECETQCKNDPNCNSVAMAAVGESAGPEQGMGVTCSLLMCPKDAEKTSESGRVVDGGVSIDSVSRHFQPSYSPGVAQNANKSHSIAYAPDLQPPKSAPPLMHVPYSTNL